jgi:hypothetical protein
MPLLKRLGPYCEGRFWRAMIDWPPGCRMTEWGLASIPISFQAEDLAGPSANGCAHIGSMVVPLHHGQACNCYRFESEHSFGVHTALLGLLDKEITTPS